MHAATVSDPFPSERHDHGRCVQTAVSRAHDLCARRGARLTPLREQVLELVWRSHAPIGAYQLMERLAESRGRVAPPTIYRALDFLKENGFIHRLESLNAFIACPHHHARGEKVVFLICETCRHVEEATAKPLDAALAGLARDHEFTAARQVVELAGTCRNCRQPAPKA